MQGKRGETVAENIMQFLRDAQTFKRTTTIGQQLPCGQEFSVDPRLLGFSLHLLSGQKSSHQSKTLEAEVDARGGPPPASIANRRKDDEQQPRLHYDPDRGHLLWQQKRQLPCNYNQKKADIIIGL